MISMVEVSDAIMRDRPPVAMTRMCSDAADLRLHLANDVVHLADIAVNDAGLHIGDGVAADDGFRA